MRKSMGCSLVLLSGVFVLAVGAATSQTTADPALLARGGEIYGTCALCHGPEGEGQAGIPALKGNPKLSDASLIVTQIHRGGSMMPPLPNLGAAEIAAVGTYIRTSWGNAFGPLSETEVASLLAGGGQSSAPGAAASAGSGWYSETQAARGEATYASRCASCHGDGGGPGTKASRLTGETFTNAWKSRTVYDLYDVIRRTMPPPPDPRLDEAATRDVVAYLLKVNGFAAGTSDLPGNEEALRKMGLAK
jgi:mono/diheme cytochrome c family protein